MALFHWLHQKVMTESSAFQVEMGCLGEMVGTALLELQVSLGFLVFLEPKVTLGCLGHEERRERWGSLDLSVYQDAREGQELQVLLDEMV